MKKKILLKTLIPLATFGITLGAALPLASCGGGISSNDDEVDFATRNDLVNYMSSHISNPESADFTKEPYDGTTEDAAMIAWVENHLDTKTILLGLAFTLMTYTATFMLDICAINFITHDLAFRCTSSTTIFTVNDRAFKDDEGIKMGLELLITTLDGTPIENDIVPQTLAPIESCSTKTMNEMIYKRFAFQDGIFYDGIDYLLFPNNIWSTVVFPSN